MSKTPTQQTNEQERMGDLFDRILLGILKRGKRTTILGGDVVETDDLSP